MAKNMSVVLYVVAMAAIIVSIDVLFFRQRLWFWERLIANIGIVLVFVAFYFRFMKNP
jgi:preprotein translocase subunit SecE